jgi:hypothetical protein
MNEAARLPARLRYDLSEIDAASAALETDPDPEIIQQKLHDLRADLANEKITAEEYAQKVEQLHNSQSVKISRSLAGLEAKVPHTSEAPDPPIDGVDLTDTAPGYMDLAHEEDYLLAIDVALANPSYNPEALDTQTLRLLQPNPFPSEKDLTIRNPDSVYNWLRKNQPQVFLQDKDAQPNEGVPEKATARSGNAGGRGKRQSAVAGTPGPKTEHDDEDSNFVPESGTGGKGKRGKAANNEDDGAYRPKGGSSRSAKRKREDGDVAPKGGRKKNRASTSAA